MESAGVTTTARTAGRREPAIVGAVLRRSVPYLLTIAAVALALLGSVELERHGFRPPVFGMFLFAIASTIWYPGVGPAIVAVVLSSLTFDYYWTEPRYSFTIVPADLPYFGAFVLFAAMLTGFSVVRRRTERQVRADKDFNKLILAYRLPANELNI